ncbi:unnamed protein product [Prorocentrum cordatum]|uniref:Reverse transcriptase Ty1/copia-type domain-containing protein n=1 Tax=Prorocentrum cordatum TaxID=2364126 RepID=A0ABN9RAD0_9DINO|nr:unnamed protein product [Polarella glacialis]
MEIGIIMSITMEKDRHVCEELEPRVNYDKLVGDGVYRDAYTGEDLLKELVINGRTKEMKSMEVFEVFEWVPLEDWMKPFDTKWIDSKKYDLQNHEWIVRSRCFHRRYSDGTDPSNFAGTPALWAVKLVISRAASTRTTESRRKKFGLYDISVALFHASLKEPQYCWPPPEQRRPGMLWKLQKAMYGTPEASMLFQGEVRDNFRQNGYEELKTVCCLYYHPGKDSLCAGHGDDFVVEAYDEELDEFDKLMASRFKVKPQPRVGPGGAAEGTFLNRTVLWGEEGFGILPDPKLILKMVELYELKQAKPAETPSSKHTAKGVRDAEDPVGRQSSMLYRSCGCIAQYMAGDRWDIQEAVREQSCSYNDPRVKHGLKQKRLVRYLKGTADIVIFYPYQQETFKVTASVDADWAGQEATCKSISSGGVRLGAHLLESWVLSQATVALSSGESEFYAMGSGTARGLTIEHALQEMAQMRNEEVKITLELETDSAAAKGMIHRHGVGRVRHLQTRWIWHQDLVRDGDMEVVKVNTKDQVADIGTKPMDKDTLRRHMKTLGLISIKATSFKDPEVLTKVLAVMTTISGAEATGDCYYEDGFRINVNMKSEFNWWSFVTHLVVTIVAVVFSYYVFVVKAKQDRAEVQFKKMRYEVS